MANKNSKLKVSDEKQTNNKQTSRHDQILEYPAAHGISCGSTADFRTAKYLQN